MSKGKYDDTNKCIIMNDDDGSLILSDDIIKKANQLITGKHKVSAVEQKIFNLSLAKVKFDIKLGRPVAELTINEMREILNCKGNSIYKHIQNVSHSLTDRKIIINNLENDEFLMIGLINIVDYKAGVMKLKFEPECTDLVLNLKSNYTKLDLSIYKNLNNIYAIRLYEIFKSKLYRSEDSLSITYGINNLKLTIGMIQINDDIHKALIRGEDIEKAVERSNAIDSFKNTGSFKRSLDSAIDEINDITDIYVEYNDIKEGKGGKIRAICFTVTDKSKLKKIKVKSDDVKPQEKDNTPSGDEIIALMFEIKMEIKEELSINDYRQLLECANYDKNKVLEKYELAKKVKNIDNLMAWMLSAIKNDYKTVETKADKKEQKETNKFNDFEQRNYSDEQLEELEKKLLAK